MTPAKSTQKSPRAKIQTTAGDLAPEELDALLEVSSEVQEMFSRNDGRGVVATSYTPDGVLAFGPNGGSAKTPAELVIEQAKMFNTLGTSSEAFVSVGLGALEWPTRSRGQARGDSSDGLNAALALVRSVKPETELEAALAMQMAATHALSMEMLGRARHTDGRDATESYVGMATKLQRTFTSQIEALSRLRGGGKQQVEVRHVYVDARGSQNVIGDVHGAAGAGAHGIGELLSGAPLPGLDAASTPMPCQDSERTPVPIAGSEGA